MNLDSTHLPRSSFALFITHPSPRVPTSMVTLTVQLALLYRLSSTSTTQAGSSYGGCHLSFVVFTNLLHAQPSPVQHSTRPQNPVQPNTSTRTRTPATGASAFSVVPRGAAFNNPHKSILRTHELKHIENGIQFHSRAEPSCTTAFHTPPYTYTTLRYTTLPRLPCAALRYAMLPAASARIRCTLHVVDTWMA